MNLNLYKIFIKKGLYKVMTNSSVIYNAIDLFLQGVHLLIVRGGKKDVSFVFNCVISII